MIQLMEMNPFYIKETYVAFTLLKLKFIKLGYFLRLSDFLWFKTTIHKLIKIPNISKMICVNLEILLYHMLLTEFGSSVKNLFFERKFNFFLTNFKII
jgi:hypothetical protein